MQILSKKEVRWRTAALCNMFNRIMNTPMVKIKTVNCFKLLKKQSAALYKLLAQMISNEQTSLTEAVKSNAKHQVNIMLSSYQMV